MDRQRVINGIAPLKPDVDVLCEECEEKVAMWIGMTYRGTSLEPPEYIYLCDEHGGSDE